MDEVGLGHRLQEARKTAGLTQQELCQKAGLSYSTLAKIERGAIKAPSIFTIQSIAKTLGVDLNELIGATTDKAAQKPKKRSKGGTRFVYFDINGCLVRFFHRAFTQIAKDTGARADTIETTFWHFNDKVCRGELGLAEFNREFAKRLEAKHIDWQQYYMKAIEPISEMHELLKWAADQYYVGLLTNIMPGFLDHMLSAKILPQVEYTAIIDSSKVKAIKPEERIYQIAQERSGVGAKEILLVDDSRSNLMAAEKMGWRVLWFDDYRPDESILRIRESLEPAE